jgi:hypothetical protein
MPKRTISQWQELIANYEQSGLGQAEWCKANNVNLYTFRDRLSKARKLAAMVQAETANPNSAANERPKKGAPETAVWKTVVQKKDEDEVADKNGEVIIRIGKFAIEVGEGAKETQIMKVCSVLVKLC